MDSYEAMQHLRGFATHHFKNRTVVYLVAENATVFATAQGAMWHAHHLLGALGLKERWESSKYALSVSVWDTKNDCPGVTVRVVEVLP